MTAPLRELVDRGPMSRFQWTAITVCVLLNVLDGFDVLVMAFTGKSVATEWGLTPGQLGLLLSAGLVGMTLGSLFVAPFADRIGRRPTILICLVVASTGMLLSAASQDGLQLGLLRVLTGIGIGGILAGSNVIATEYASKRWRGLAVSLNSLGYAVGATVGGLLAVTLISGPGWRAVFLVGGLGTLAAVPIVVFALPESMDHLLSRRPRNALERINALARRMGVPTLDAMPATDDSTRRAGGLVDNFRSLLEPGLRRSTLVLWGVFFLVVAGFYFVTSWTPTLLVEAGMSASEGLTGGTLLNLGGMLGATLFGVLASRWALRTVLASYLVLTAGALLLFVLSLSSLTTAFAAGALLGLFVNGCLAGLYSLTPNVYPTEVRATGVGTVIGVGRIGAILSPAVAGFLLQGGWTPQSLYIAFAVVFLAGAALLLLLRAPDAVRAPERGPVKQLAAESSV